MGRYDLVTLWGQEQNVKKIATILSHMILNEGRMPFKTLWNGAVAEPRQRLNLSADSFGPEMKHSI